MNPKDRAGAKKPNLSVLPFAPLLDVIPALYEGRRKYGPWNWRAEEVSETIYADAAIRHLMQFIAGEDIDPDSGVHHISKAIAGLLVVRDAQIHGCSIDDRYVNQDLQIDKQIEQLAGVNERYPEPVESALPPRNGVKTRDLPSRDEGITGGETMTEEDAEKVAEYLGLREAAEERPVIEQVKQFDLSYVDVGDRVIFTSGEEGVLSEIDEEDPILPLFVFCKGLGHWYELNGRTNQGDKSVDDNVKQIASIVSGPLTQTVLHFELDKPTCGTDFNMEGKISRWSHTVAGGGSYELKPHDVGKRVVLRDGQHTRIESYNASSQWPFEYTADEDGGPKTVTCNPYGQFDANACPGNEWGGPFVEGLDNPVDIVRVIH